MSAPAKSKGGKSKRLKAAPSVPRNTRGSASLRKPPKGHTSLHEARKPPRSSGPPRYTNKSVRPQLLHSALQAAEKRGYQALRISDITDPVNVTRQAFYAHFRDKRHCLCEALDPRLAGVLRIASEDPDGSGGEFGSEWSAKVLDSIDELLGEYFGSAEGTKGRLIEALATELQSTSSLAGVRVGNLVKRARVPQGDFYRCFSGKRECFAALYEERLEALTQATELTASAASAEPGQDELLAALADELAADPDRARLLVLGDGELPLPEGPEMLGSRRGALNEAVARLIDPDDGEGQSVLAGALVEVIRTATLAGELDLLGQRLVETVRIVPLSGDRTVPLAA